jgi:arylsulfatase A-like enzyme
MRAIVLCCLVASVGCATSSRPPNIVLVLADDLGYGELGVYGQRLIKTPRLDRMAAEGMRFRQFYAGTSVCAPSRGVLMTGRHTGHAVVRGNAGNDIQTLGPNDITVAKVLKRAGYATALVGKWGLGDQGNTGHPNDHGFDFFYGYMNQVHAHNYYPEFLWRNRAKEPLDNVVQRTGLSPAKLFEGAGYATRKVQYSHDLIVDEALGWIEAQKDRPFFVYLAATIPHANNEATKALGDGLEVPDYGEYAARDWPAPAKAQAAMVSRLDRDVGRLLDRLAALGLERSTVVMFSSDNGPHNEGGHDPTLFAPNGPLRGYKRALYEGGIRVPLIVRWPGTTPAGAVSEHVGYFGDFMTTAAELAGVAPPASDGISFAPTIAGRPAAQRNHDHLYWEFYEQGGRQAVRFGNWKAVRQPMRTGPIELFDLASDLGEARDVAADHPNEVARAAALMQQAHVPNPIWKVRGTAPPPPPPGSGGRAP